MDLSEAMRTQNACRYYRDDPVPLPARARKRALQPAGCSVTNDSGANDSGRNGRKTASDSASAE